MEETRHRITSFSSFKASWITTTATWTIFSLHNCDRQDRQDRAGLSLSLFLSPLQMTNFSISYATQQTSVHLDFFSVSHLNSWVNSYFNNFSTRHFSSLLRHPLFLWIVPPMTPVWVPLDNKHHLHIHYIKTSSSFLHKTIRLDILKTDSHLSSSSPNYLMSDHNHHIYYLPFRRRRKSRAPCVDWNGLCRKNGDTLIVWDRLCRTIFLPLNVNDEKEGGKQVSIIIISPNN